MKTTKLHTFEEVLTHGITVDGQDDPIQISAIFIPKIQRSYAQGRKSENDIRRDFLDDIFATLVDEKETTLELSFLFGSKQALVNGASNGFELLDGQQRATTLFLLYWYINNRESKLMPDFLRKFTYETRDTSTDFLRNISLKKFDLINAKPSDALKANKWFTDDYNCDPTISAMLNMLDEIHSRYNLSQVSDMASKLTRLQFYVLLLEKFDMNDELYIKMNSRGLSLVPFENFKASIVRYMKGHPQKIYGDDDPDVGEIPYWLDFVSKIDASWIDIFWQSPLPNDDEPVSEEIIINDNDIGNRYLRFLNRYFFTKAAIIDGVENKKLHTLPNFFYRYCENVSAEQRLTGWSYYEVLFRLIEESQKDSVLPSAKYPVFSAIEKIFDTYKKNKNFILECVNADPYGNTSNFDVLKKNVTVAWKEYTFSHRIIFAAVTEFIEAIPDGFDFDSEIVQANFKRMIRVAHNVIENTLIETDIATVGVIKALSEIINYPNATNVNFYLSLANNELRSRNVQLQDEKEKAEEMFDENGDFLKSWEDAFIEAESHPFFKGSVTFFFTPKVGDSNTFLERYNVIKQLFDKNGISDKFRKDEHILIRALLSCYNHWDKSGLQNRYFTENVEKEKYLKSLVIGNEEVRKMFCNYFCDTNVTMSDYLKNVVSVADCLPGEQNVSFKMLFHRLVNDTNSSGLFDGIAANELSKGACYRMMSDRRGYFLYIPNFQKVQIVLDTERHLIIPYLVENYGFSYKLESQKNDIISPLKDYFWWNVEIHKKLIVGKKEYCLVLVFDEYKNVVFHVYGSDVKELEMLFNVTDNNNPNGVVVPGFVHYQFDKNKQSIIDKLLDIENKIKLIAQTYPETPNHPMQNIALLN